MIVCIEGIDGAGKTTQVQRLAKTLCAQVVKFPDKDTPTGRLIYAHLEKRWWVDGRAESLPDLARDEALVFQALQLANRMEHAERILRISAEQHVVLDRYWPSGVAYGVTDGLDAGYLAALHATLPQPDVFLLLDVSADRSFERRAARRDRYEADITFLAQVAESYRELWLERRAADPRRWVFIDAGRAEDAVEHAILEAVRPLLPAR